MTMGDIQRRFAANEITAKQAADETMRLHRWGRDNGLERFLLRLAIGVVVVVVLAMLPREP